MMTRKFLQRMLASQFDSYRKKHKQPLRVLKAVEAIINCRTTENGATCYHCPDQHEAIEIPHSCKHRSCPQCAPVSQREWIEKQKQRLLPCAHYHLVFTLPHDYLTLWQYNRKWFVQAQFDVCRDVLMELMGDARYLGAQPGILMALHTWGRQLNLHPHIHCLVTAGGLMPNGEWKNVDGDYLLPIQVVKALYRGKFQHRLKQALDKGELTLPDQDSPSTIQQLIKAQYNKPWSVRIEEKYAHGKGVLLYLSRYLKGGPIKPAQIQHMDDREVIFRYKDHRDQRIKPLRLTSDEFIRRLLLHIPEPGLHTVRHYGLYAAQAQSKRQICREQIAQAAGSDTPSVEEMGDKLELKVFCRHCGAAMVAGLRRLGSRWGENSYRQGVTPKAYVQQGVQAAPAGRRRPERSTSETYAPGNFFAVPGAA